MDTRFENLQLASNRPVEMQRRLASRYILFNKHGSVDASVGVVHSRSQLGLVEQRCSVRGEDVYRADGSDADHVR
jgi:hypothetical protein